MTAALLLDVLGTLVRDPFAEDVPAALGLTLPELLARKDPDAWGDFERGALSEAELGARYYRDRSPCDLDAFKQVLSAGYRYLPGVEPLLAELRAAGVPLHALSNYPPWYRLIEEQLTLSRYVRWSFVSCETGLRKPDPRAYQHALRSLGLPPAACLFVDDQQVNCDAAQAVGIPAVRFRGAEELRRRLVARGLLAGR